MKLAPREFIALVAPIAIVLRLEGSPIFPSLRIAQAAHETGWTIHDWNNLVGYKVGSGTLTSYWRGRSVSTKTWEVYEGVRYDDAQANWRAYDSIADCFRDQDLLFEWSRYDRVRAARTPEEQAHALQACGYATDPAYTQMLINTISLYDLKKFDDEVIRVLAEIRNEINNLQERMTELENEKKQAAPEWFVKEFGSSDLGGLINDPHGSEGFWRTIAVVMRAAKAGKLGLKAAGD